MDPIRDSRKIESIKKLLSSEPRNNLLFILGINNGIRTGDLVRLKIGQVRNLKPGDHIRIIESKTGKSNIIGINKSAHKSLNRYLESKPELTDDDFLFQSRKGNNPVTVGSVSRLVKSWTRAVGLKGKYGAHTLRKTFGYMQRKKHGVGFDVLCQRFNHSSPAVTMRYLGITKKEVSDILMNEI